jgi:2-polyprenyl-3-methyl-5-hydroxy-6-metoxy-1,4-benzoquinol methylase
MRTPERHSGIFHLHRRSDIYDTNYRHFETELSAQIRREAFGEDIGQNSWLTADEHDNFVALLNLCPGRKLLDVACGAGGPALRAVAKTGCSVLGIDIHRRAISAANLLVAERGLGGVAEFRVEDAAQPLPIFAGSLDAIICIDAINHFPNRERVISDWARLLKPAGRLLFTDPTVVTGPLTNQEIKERTCVGFYLLTTLAYNENVLRECGLSTITIEDVTHRMAESAFGRKAARAAHESELRATEGDDRYGAHQAFLGTVETLARERRLSRFVFSAEKR